MNEQKKRANASKLGVSAEIYAFLRRSNRRIRYLTYDIKTEQIVIEGDKITVIPSREDSLDRMLEQGNQFASEEKSIEDIVADSILHEQLHAALLQLNDGERRLIEEIFFSKCGEGKAERKVADSLGLPQKTINNRKRRILAKLKKLLEIQK